MQKPNVNFTQTFTIGRFDTPLGCITIGLIVTKGRPASHFHRLPLRPNDSRDIGMAVFIEQPQRLLEGVAAEGVAVPLVSLTVGGMIVTWLLATFAQRRAPQG